MNEKIKRYQLYNRSRKIRAIRFQPETATILFRVIPYLLHCNYPDLPGFIDHPKCPYGIQRFSPDKTFDPDLFSRYFPNSTARNHKTTTPYSSSPCIHSLKTIGSIGTIAQSAKSDCDYWVSIRRQEIGEEGLTHLLEKCRLIEQWAIEHGIEVYFFLMDIDQTRKNDFESAVGDESAGSALKLLLKDELFRSHILVAGKMLLWWLIPSGLTEEEYQKYVEDLIYKKHLNPENFVDLGYIADIPKSEIFGACLWQMNKALDSPFKSLIKFAYLEILMQHNTKSVPLFSNKIQALVTFPEYLSKEEKNLSPAAVDPYLLLARKIVDFYRKDISKTENRSEENLIRECLFLKAMEGMKTVKDDQHMKVTLQLMKRWNLLPANYKSLATLHTWQFKKQQETGKRVHAFLLATYTRLREQQSLFAEVDNTITQRDLSILGKKLFSFYENKPGKIPYLHSLSRYDIGQQELTFYFSKQRGGDIYAVYQGRPGGEDIRNEKAILIHQEKDLVQLAVWLVINGILQKKTQLHMVEHSFVTTLDDLQKLTDKLLSTFPLISFSRISAEEILSNEKTIQALAIINLHKDQVKGSKELRSDIITQNNCGEYFIQTCTTLVQLKNAMRMLLTKYYVSRWNNNLDFFIPPQPEQHYLQNMLEK